MIDKNIFQLVLFITELIQDESTRPKLKYLGNMGYSLIGLSCRPNPAPSRPSPAGCSTSLPPAAVADGKMPLNRGFLPLTVRVSFTARAA